MKSPGIKPKHKHLSNNTIHNNHHRTSICKSITTHDNSPPDGSSNMGLLGHECSSVFHTHSNSNNFAIDTISIMSSASTLTNSYDVNTSLSHSPMFMSHLTSSTADIISTSARADISPIYQPNTFSRFKSNKTPQHLEPSDSRNRSPSSPKVSTNFHFFPTTTTTTTASPSHFNETEPVPPSPHVNVPNTAAPLPLPPPIYPHHSQTELRQPPPLPPRRNDAQRKQAPDAPQLPPRDEEVNPPPLPPRSHHNILTPPLTTTSHDHNNKILRDKPLPPISSSSSLLQPNTSTIMMRRNSALEKQRASQNSTDNENSSSTSTAAVQQPLQQQPSAITAARTYHQAGEENLTSISPAFSSSTTSTPCTPMTPISPSIFESSSVVDTSTVNSLISSRDFVTSNNLPSLPPKPASSGLFSNGKFLFFFLFSFI